MQRMAKGVAWITLAVIVIVLGAYAWGRLRPPTATQRHALALLREDPAPPPGRNAFPVFWLMDFDVPADQLAAAYAKDRERMAAWHASYDRAHPTLAPQAHADAPTLTFLTEAERRSLCGPRDAGCIGEARTHALALHELLNAHPTLLAKDISLADFDVLWNDMPKDPGVPMPPFEAASGLWQTAIALDYVDGMQAKALDDACIQVKTLRRLHAHSNTMVGTLILGSRLRGAAHLVTQLLAETPVETALPTSCGEAFAPVTADDVNLCPQLGAEFAMLASPQILGRQEHWYDSVYLSRDLTLRLLAPHYAAACEPATVQRTQADDGVDSPPGPPAFDVFDLVANSAGVALSRTSLGDLTPELQSQQDVAASLRMGALILWLRESHGDGRSISQRVAARPAWMRFGEDRQFDVAPDGRSITMYYRHDAHKEWPHAWPLPTGI